MPHEDWNLTIGEIVAPFGIAGEAKVRLETDFPERFLSLRRVCLLLSSGERRLLDIEGCRIHKGQALLRLRGVKLIEDVDVLRGSLVLVRQQDAVRLPPGEYFHHQLIGCDVVTSEGKALGTLTSIMRTLANDVYVIGSGKSEILLPAIKDVVRNIDIEARRIEVTPTPGLLSDELAQNDISEESAVST